MIIYLHQDFHNVGLGSAMLKHLLALAKDAGLHRIGLSVVADNKLAVHLYEKFGFVIEGVKKDSYFGEDKMYHDELIMGLIINHSSTKPS